MLTGALGARSWALLPLRQPGVVQRRNGHRNAAVRRRKHQPAAAAWGDALQQAAGSALPQLVLAGLAAFGAAAWLERPRGWSRRDLIEVRESAVAGLGVFALVPIPEGTVLGAFPGRPRSPAGMRAKVAQAPEAAAYCFSTGRTAAAAAAALDGGGWEVVLDPTDTAGAVSAWPGPGLPWLPVDPALARVNEPPPGARGGANVAVADDPRDRAGIVYVAARALAAGEELFVDYGRAYDRSSYGGGGGGGG